MAEAVRMSIERNLRLASKAAEWKDWRLKTLYTVEVNDMFTTNLDLLAQVYSHVMTQDKRKLSRTLTR